MLYPFRIIFALDRLFARLEGFLLSVTLIVMLSFASLQVILRNFFDTGIEWGDVFARHLVLWVGFFGATLSTKEDRHIRIDAFTKIIPARWKPLVDFLVCCFCIVVGLFLYDAAAKFVLSEKMAGTTLFKGIPTWYFIVIMPAGFLVISFRYLVFLLGILAKLSGKDVEKMLTKEESPEIEISVKVKLP